MDTAAREFWNRMAERRFVVQRCAECGVLQHPPGPWCRRCGTATALEWSPHPGTGRIVSATQVFRTTYFELEAELPYWVVMVELAPGAVMVSNLVPPAGAVPGREPRIGDAVQVTFRERGGNTLPLFRLVDREEQQ